MGKIIVIMGEIEEKIYNSERISQVKVKRLSKLLIFKYYNYNKKIEIIKNSNEEFFHHLETIQNNKQKKEAALKPSNKLSDSIINNENEGKFFISLPDNVIKTRIRSTILEILLEKVEKKDFMLTLKEIKENEKMSDMLKVEPNANKFFTICFEEIINQKFLQQSDNSTIKEEYIISEQIWKNFFDFIKGNIISNDYFLLI